MPVRNDVKRWMRSGARVLVALAWLAPAAAVAEGPAAVEEVGIGGSLAAVRPGGWRSTEEPFYDPTDRRDPFRPYALSIQPRNPEGPRTPLQQYELSQLRLVAIVSDGQEPRAVVEDSTGLGYIVRLGTPIGTNSGRVQAIEPGRVVIEEWPVDVFGERRSLVVVKELTGGEEAKR
jgi:hypothetical protein